MLEGVTAIIVAYHRPERLQELLQRLGATTAIVVNVENDSAVRAVAAGVTIVVPRGNPGFGAAVNFGLRYVRTDLVCFMNDDVCCGEEQIRALAESLRTEGQVAIPRVLDRFGAVERTILPLPSLPALLREWALIPDGPIPFLERVVAPEKWRLPLRTEPILAASAMCVATYTSLLRAEPIPEAYFLYWEEAEWFWRLNRRGVQVLYRPSIEITHFGGRRDLRPEKARLLARNAVRCIRRTQGRRASAAAWPVVVVWQARLLAVDLLRGLRPGRDRTILKSRVAGFGAALAAWKEIVE